MTEEDHLLLNELKRNMQQLFGVYRALEQENEVLQQELAKLRDKLNLLEHERLELSRKNEQLKLANQFLSEQGDKQEAKQKINSLIREIDKCIALLNT